VSTALIQSDPHSDRYKPAAGLLLSVLLAASLFIICADEFAHAAEESPQISLWRFSNLNDLDTTTLRLRSAVALVADQYGRRVYAKHSGDVKPIASITKLMTAMVVLDANLPMGERITILEVDRDRLRHSRSRLRTNRATLSRRELLTIALMSSENRAAAALGRTSLPGGTPAFVEAMNRKAKSIGMRNSHFADASGLNGANRSTAEDLVKMLQAASRYPFIRTATTTTSPTRFRSPSGRAPTRASSSSSPSSTTPSATTTAATAATARAPRRSRRTPCAGRT